MPKVSKQKTARPADQTRTLRLIVALCAVLASAGCVVASTLTWLTLPDGAGGTTAVSGWGAISGGSQISGENINDAMNGNATFRPGMFAVVIGSLALLAAIGIALVARGRTPHRIPAAVLVVCGLAGLAWGIIRGVSPDSAGVLNPGEGASGVGSWLTAGCSLVLLAAAVVVFTGLLDPPKPLGRRGIQPR
jgi:hypothetical protein